MKTSLYTFLLLITCSLYSQQKNILVEYDFKNAYINYKETLIASSTHSFYTNEEMNLEAISKPKIDKGGDEIQITQSNVKLKKKKLYANLNSAIIDMIMPTRKDYLYVKDSIVCNWKIHKDSKLKIAEYACTKATLEFRGRSYEVYFTEEIPIAAGPWKLRGLPGLILYAKATSGPLNYVWKAKKIIYPFTSPIMLRHEATSSPISLKEYTSILAKEMEKQNNTIHARRPEGVRAVSSKSTRVGLELEYEWEK